MEEGSINLLKSENDGTHLGRFYLLRGSKWNFCGFL